MGRVWEAHNTVIGRSVALKVGPAAPIQPDVYDRLRREVEVLASLGHPAIVPAIDMGFSGDSFWLIMPLIDGQTLREKLQSAGRLPFREAATLVAELAEAVHLAHEQGLVHGDLKPEHIHLGADGQARLLGFGEFPLQTANSVPGRFVGTPAYSAPERVRGELAICDAQAEVYALGVILYEIMTGVLPFAGATVAEVFARITNDEPKRPRRLVRSIPVALESICLKAIARDRAVRYGTAGELAAALREFLTPSRRTSFWTAIKGAAKKT